MRWDDLKYLSAVADAGALAPAARALGVDASTVSRRIAALEEALGTELTARTPEGMVLTEAGRAAVEVARGIEVELTELAERIAGGHDALTGRLRVSTTESFAAYVLQALAPLSARHPALQIEVVTMMAPADLRRREADLAVRFYREDHDGLAMRRLGTLGWSLYAAPSYLARRCGTGLDLEGHDIVGFGADLQQAPGPRWLAEHTRPDALRIRCSSPPSALQAAIAGLGVAILPCYLAAGQAVVRLTEQVLAVTEAWAVFLPERQHEARIHAGITALVELFAAHRDRFVG